VRSEVTFGPLGRIVVSLLMLIPLWWFFTYAGIFGLIGIPIWLVKVLPWALRDIWRPVQLPGNDTDRISAQHALLRQSEAEPDTPSIAERSSPGRW